MDGASSLFLLLIISIAGSILELLIQVDSSRLRLPVHEVQVFFSWANLGVGLRHKLALIFALGQPQRAILLLEDVALFEHGVDLGLHVPEVVEVLLSLGRLLLHFLEAPDLLSYLRLLLLCCDLFLLDLNLGLPPLGPWLHQVTGPSLGDYNE